MIGKVFLKIFAGGVLVTLFAGALAFIGFLVALVIGGETATEICVYIHKVYFPFVIRVCSISVGFGLVGMYCSKIKSLSMEKN